MAYGLQVVLNQQRMIDENPAGQECKQTMRLNPLRQDNRLLAGGECGPP